MKRLKGEIERMKKVMKRVITACLAFAMILARRCEIFSVNLDLL